MRLDHWQLGLVAVLSASLGAWLTLQLSRWLRGVRGRAIQAHGVQGEAEAERLLIARGYTIVARQQRARYVIDVDGDAREVTLSFDFVVEREGTQWVAECKTGAAANIGHAVTRRQLLEYQLATSSRAVLLVDPEAEAITEVAFPLQTTASQPATHTRALLWLVLALIATVAYAAWRVVDR